MLANNKEDISVHKCQKCKTPECIAFRNNAFYCYMLKFSFVSGFTGLNPLVKTGKVQIKHVLLPNKSILDFLHLYGGAFKTFIEGVFIMETPS